MNSESARLPDYIDHIIQAIEKIQEYTLAGKSKFFESELHQDAVIRNFEIIGEASRNIRHRFPDFVEAHPELPLKVANEMRNVLAHGYFSVDLEILWKTVENDLEPLKEKLIAIKSE